MNSPQHNFATISQRMNIGSKGRVTASFRDYTVASAFQPIFSLSHSSPVGYEALCRVTNSEATSISPAMLFGQMHDESDNVLLDRMCRALHVKNFAKFSDKAWLFLNVNPLVTVLGKNYGPFFKEMLEQNHIEPAQVVIEVLEKSIYDESILSEAINYYKNLGCLVAIDDFGVSHSNFDRLWNIKPDIVKFDRSIVVQAEASRVVRKALPNLVALIQELGCLTLMESVETEQQALIAIDANVDLVQGYYFGYPREQLVSAEERGNMLPQLYEKYLAFSTAARTRQSERLNAPLAEFKAVLNVIKMNALAAELACDNLIAMPYVMRVYFLDEGGNQIGANLTNLALLGQSDTRYRPLFEAQDANWARCHYFRQAVLNPGEVQITRPYRSLADKIQCITISALINTANGKLIACLDLDWTQGLPL